MFLFATFSYITKNQRPMVSVFYILLSLCKMENGDPEISKALSLERTWSIVMCFS